MQKRPNITADIALEKEGQSGIIFIFDLMKYTNTAIDHT